MDNKLACLMDWDLQAIVGGCTNEAPAAIIHNPHPNFSYFCYELDHDLLRSFPAFSETTSVLDELEEPRKPSYPVLHPLSTQITIPSSVPIPNEVKASDKVLDSKDLAASRCKRSKKNQHKRVVKQVTADGLCDAGAWRKYGQKPIKGSPYPRSYYRCSSSKGCAARKQVERSHLDPEVFIVTYTAEHSHHHSTRPWRTRKNKDSIAPETTQHTCSPRTPLVESIVDELVPSGQSEGLNKGEDLLVLSEDAPVTANILGSDDWFPSIEELNELSQEFALFMDTFAKT